MTLNDFIIGLSGFLAMFLDSFVKGRHKTLKGYWKSIYEDQRIIATIVIGYLGICAGSYISSGYIDWTVILFGVIMRDQLSTVKNQITDPNGLKGKIN